MVRQTPSVEHTRAMERTRDKRLHERSQRLEPTYIFAKRQLCEGTIKNMSAGGIFIQTTKQFEIGEEVIVAGTFGADGGEEKRFGKIVRMDDNGIAVKFTGRHAISAERTTTADSERR